MKRKIFISILIILICAISIFLARRQDSHIEDAILTDITLNDELFNVINVLYLDHHIPIAIEIDYASYHPSEKIRYSAKETTVRELLNTIVPKEEFVWKVDGDFIHIISKTLLSRSDYQLNIQIKSFYAADIERDVLIKRALDQASIHDVPEPIAFTGLPYAKLSKSFRVNLVLPKISIDLKNVTLREVLDQISKKSGVSYCVLRNRKSDGSYMQGLIIFENLPIGLSGIPVK